MKLNMNFPPFKTILADPPWELSMRGKRKRAKEPNLPGSLPYPTMTLDEICALPIGNLSSDDCHLWLWTTNQHLADGFHVMDAWGFHYLAPIHWIKPSGVGNWFVHRTQTILFGYRKCCHFDRARYRPNIVLTGSPKRHSEKPEESYRLIEDVSSEPRLELFSRRKRPGWYSWGNEITNDIEMTPNHPLSHFKP
jgi:N6-adenosine-specific RNA methylase IME4